MLVIAIVLCAAATGGMLYFFGSRSVGNSSVSDRLRLAYALIASGSFFLAFVIGRIAHLAPISFGLLWFALFVTTLILFLGFYRRRLNSK